MIPIRQLLVFSSTPDVAADNFVVPILAEPLDALAGRAADLGYDGLEFLPNPDDMPSAERLSAAVEAAGISVGVVNSGRLAVRGYALLHRDAERRRASIDAFNRLIDLAGALGARVGLGMARGDSRVTAAAPDLPSIMRDVFGEIGARAPSIAPTLLRRPVSGMFSRLVRNPDGGPEPDISHSACG